MNNIELKPCPICGCPVDCYKWKPDEDKSILYCTNEFCGLHYEFWSKDAHRAIAAWNRRCGE